MNKARIENAAIVSYKGEREAIVLPFYSDNQEPGNILFSFTLINSRLFSGTLRILPDDCITEIKINDQLVPAHLLYEKNCDGTKGLNIDVAPYLVRGNNIVKITVQNIQGASGLSVKDLTSYEKYIAFFLCFSLSFFIRYHALSGRIVRLTKRFYLQYKTLIWANLAFLILFILSFFLSLTAFDYSSFFWILILELTSIVGFNCYYFIRKQLMFGKTIAWLFLGMSFLFTTYFIFLHHSRFSYDYDGHLEYIKYMIYTGVVPEAHGGWSFYHNSLYYRLVSIFWKIFESGDDLNDLIFHKAVQAFSLIIFFIYVLFSLKTIDMFFLKIKSRLNLPDDQLRVICLAVSALFLAWPANAIFSVRVGNDLMFDLFYSIAFYHIVRWYWSDRLYSFLLSLVFISFAIWSKTNGFVLYGVLGCLFLFKTLGDIRIALSSQRVLKGFLFTLFLSIGLYQSFQERFERLEVDADTRIVVGNANGLGDDLVAGNQPKNYLVFNPVKFVEIPFTDTRDEAKGKSYFWFFLFKSSMFGEFSFDSPALIFLARVLSPLLLVLMLFAAYGASDLVGYLQPLAPFMAGALVLVLSLLVFRIYYPYSSSNDFRYIFPAITPFVVFIGTALFRLSRSNRLFSLSLLLVTLFLTSGIAFQILAILRYAER